MKEKTKRTNSNKPICSKNNNEHVGAGLVPAHNKGITLIALILTIIVLLILAVVAINAVKGDGIIAHAKNAKTDYTNAQANEQELLSNYELMLAQETGNAWKQEKTKVTKGNTTLNVGDTITNFTAGNKTWKVLGAENGKLLLTTSTNVNSITLRGSTAGWSETEKRFVDAEKALDDECKSKITLTEEEKKQVSELRSIKVEDIDRVTGYDKTKYGEKQVYQYGNKVTYSMNASGKVAYSSATKSSEGTSQTQFWAPNTSANITSPYTVTSTYYSYDVDTATDLTTNSAAYSLLFGNDDQTYWLASSDVIANEGLAGFGLRIVGGGSVDRLSLLNSYFGEYSYARGVRPVVSLASDFQPER